VFVLSKLFRRLMLDKLVAAYEAGRLQFLSSFAHLAEAKAFTAFLVPLRKKRWFVYAKRPFACPKAVLAYLSQVRRRPSRLLTRRSSAVPMRAIARRLQCRGSPHAPSLQQNRHSPRSRPGD
jgi:hypothetical protein